MKPYVDLGLFLAWTSVAFIAGNVWRTEKINRLRNALVLEKTNSARLSDLLDQANYRLTRMHTDSAIVRAAVSLVERLGG